SSDPCWEQLREINRKAAGNTEREETDQREQDKDRRKTAGHQKCRRKQNYPSCKKTEKRRASPDAIRERSETKIAKQRSAVEQHHRVRRVPVLICNAQPFTRPDLADNRRYPHRR